MPDTKIWLRNKILGSLYKIFITTHWSIAKVQNSLLLPWLKFQHIQELEQPISQKLSYILFLSHHAPQVHLLFLEVFENSHMVASVYVTEQVEEETPFQALSVDVYDRFLTLDRDFCMFTRWSLIRETKACIFICIWGERGIGARKENAHLLNKRLVKLDRDLGNCIQTRVLPAMINYQ